MSGGISATTIATAVAAAATVAGTAYTMSQGSPKAPTAPPPIPAPAVAPTMDDAAIQDAKKRQMAENAARSGRASTILSDSSGSDKLGG